MHTDLPLHDVPGRPPSIIKRAMKFRHPFHPAVDRWFSRTFGTPTGAQAEAWPAIMAGRTTLIAAPTGSGKTLAAFLAAIDSLVRQGLDAPLKDQTQVVYVSPLNARSDRRGVKRRRLPSSVRQRGVRRKLVFRAAQSWSECVGRQRPSPKLNAGTPSVAATKASQLFQLSGIQTTTRSRLCRRSRNFCPGVTPEAFAGFPRWLATVPVRKFCVHVPFLRGNPAPVKSSLLEESRHERSHCSRFRRCRNG
jgi:hypothetical protein